MSRLRLGRTSAVASVSVEVEAAPEAVWSILADADAYGDWVVGSRQVLRADENWPEPGSQLEYELGVGAAAITDRTVVVESSRPRVLVLRAHLRPLGAMTIRLELQPRGENTFVVMDEHPAEGVIEAVHTRIADKALEQRNKMALGRLKRLAEGRR